MCVDRDSARSSRCTLSTSRHRAQVATRWTSGAAPPCPCARNSLEDNQIAGNCHARCARSTEAYSTLFRIDPVTTSEACSTTAPRALRADEAGKFLADLIGRERPFPATTMWRLARQRIIKTIHVGRLYYYRTVDLEQFVADGGCGFENRREPV